MKRVSHPSVTLASGVAAIAIAGEVTVYTKAFKLAFGEYFSLFYKLASEGTVNVRVELEQCWTFPSTEGSQDNNYVEPEGMSDIDTVTDETQHCKSISPIPSEYGRLKLTGLSGNDASTVLTAKLGKQEEY